MNEKDLSRMSDEELKEFIKRFYDQLDKEPDCSVCPVTSCPRRRSALIHENGEFPDEEGSQNRNRGSG